MCSFRRCPWTTVSLIDLSNYLEVDLMILFVPLAYQIQPSLQAVTMFKVAAGEGTTNSFKAMAVCPLEFQSTAGLTMRVGRVRATRTQTATVTKISTDTIVQIDGGQSPGKRYLCPPYVLFDQGSEVHPIDRVGEILSVNLSQATCMISHDIALDFTWRRSCARSS